MIIELRIQLKPGHKCRAMIICVDTFYAHELVYVYIFRTLYKCINKSGFIYNCIADEAGMFLIIEASSL